jgi:cyclophilin family peptidyl-prolyl cis-trans isomerase
MKTLHWTGLCLITLLAACGGGGGDDEPTSPTPPPGPTGPTVTAVTAGALAAPTGAPRYRQSMLVNVTGTGLDQGLSLSAPGCTGFAAAGAPYTNTATQAYYTCTVTAVGAQRVAVAATAGGTALGGVDVTVPQPQVTVTVGNGAAVAGSFVITLDPAKAPTTVDNFLAYVQASWYDGTVFHRNAPGFVLQGGGYAGPLTTGPLPALKATNAPIALEVGKGLSNVRYTVAMARTNVLNSATSQFFINVVDNVFLDTSGGGYAVFGSISSGTAVVDAMQTAPCSATAWLGAGECLPVPNLTISSAAQTR